MELYLIIGVNKESNTFNKLIIIGESKDYKNTLESFINTNENFNIVFSYHAIDRTNSGFQNITTGCKRNIENESLRLDAQNNLSISDEKHVCYILCDIMNEGATFDTISDILYNFQIHEDGEITLEILRKLNKALK